jgi:hypothetical protein
MMAVIAGIIEARKVQWKNMGRGLWDAPSGIVYDGSYVEKGA